MGSVGSVHPTTFRQSQSKTRNEEKSTLGSIPIIGVLFLVQGISWKAVQYIISEIQYGGRITDDRDRQLMITYAKVFHIFRAHLFQQFFTFYMFYP